ncbi:MAG TPA: hypothetical protein VHZ26_03095 [Caulobacteraceae bacterium]|jgi:hypothetical protein|nr:hypothetical protein [Caulobacteraceae bacterium]
MKRLALIALLGMAACSKGGGAGGGAPAKLAGAFPISAAPAAPAAAPSARLAQIFTADMLGANLAYLETITGPAFKTEGDDRIYKLDGCTVVVGATRGKIDNLGIIDVSPRCSFNIAQYFAGGYDHPVPSFPTFGDIKQGLGGDYAADCLRLCGNAADPVVSLSYEGSHADNYNELVASASPDGGPMLDAYTDWGDQLVARYGEQAVVDNRYDDNLDAVASKDFGPIHPTTIRVGTSLITAPG